MTAPRFVQGERRSWQVELDVSAPQILFAEELCDRDASVLVVDFGRLRLTNAPPPGAAAATPPTEDEEMFMTPCSTPPASLLSPAEPPEPAEPAPPLAAPPLDAADLHTRLYDRSLRHTYLSQTRVDVSLIIISRLGEYL